MDLVTVIIPAYNVERCIRQCVESVLAQDYPDLEILCIDDASPDSTAAILEELQARDDRITVVRQRENRGGGATRNHGIAMARGRYLVFIDSDDYIDPRFISSLVETASRTGARMVVSRSYQLFDAGRVAIPKGRAELPEGAATYEQYLELYLSKQLAGWRPSVFAERSLMMEHGIRYREGVRYAQDFPLEVQLPLFAGSVGFASGALYYYRQTRGSLVHAYGADLRDLESLISGLRAGRAVLAEHCGDTWTTRYNAFCYFRIVRTALKMLRHGLSRREVLIGQRMMADGLDLPPLSLPRLLFGIDGLTLRQKASYVLGLMSPALAAAVYARVRGLQDPSRDRTDPVE
jgi:glycosyltransferase involved in cell wall biosynthesis